MSRCVVLVAFLGLAFEGSVAAHGGRYRGPGQLAPPLAPARAVPVAPGPRPVMPARPVAPGPRLVIAADLTQWQFWWEVNKDRLVGRRPAVVKGPRVTARQIADQVLPAVQRALAVENRDMQAASAIALAKIGRRTERKKVVGLIKGLLSSSQQVQESAALALGIAGMSESVPDLEALAGDTERGRQLVGSKSVPGRTRAFACYGLGLLAERSPELYIKQRVWKVLHAVLHGAASKRDDLAVAAIQAMSILRLAPVASPVGRRALRDQVLASLELYRDQGSRPIVKGHLAPAIARLLGPGASDRHGRHKDRLLGLVQAAGPVAGHIRRGAVIGLGGLALAPETEASDGRHSVALQELWKTGKDQQARYLALVALGRIGGSGNREFLLQVLATGKKALDRPWAAMAVGVMQAARLAADPQAVPDAGIGKALLKQLELNRNPSSRSAFAVALGLCRYRPATPVLLTNLKRYAAQDGFAGYLATGLAMLGDATARPPIRALVERSSRRPDLLRVAAQSLARFGDQRDSKLLVDCLRRGSKNLALCVAMSSALGRLGDPASIGPLVEIADDDTAAPLMRAFAIGALGELADPASLPFHSSISHGLNYRAMVRTLVYHGTGVLEIL